MMFRDQKAAPRFEKWGNWEFVVGARASIR